MIYHIEYTSKFKKQHKLLKKQRKNLNKLYTVIEKLANGEQLDEMYLNHKLFRDKYYVDCYECHIEPDWLLIYKYYENELVLLIVATGSHSEVF